MKKILLAVVLCIAMAAPAFALDTSLHGFYRMKMYMTNLSHFNKDQNTNKFVDQRFRAKATLNMNEYVSVVYYGEVDMVWGDNSYGIGGRTRNSGGGIGGDTVNLETKNLYAVVKVPDTPVGFQVGLQTYVDNFSQVVFLADMAGVKAAGKIGPVSGNLGWFKWQEAAFNEEDDIDLWSAQLAFVPAGQEALELGLDGYWININGGPAGTTSLKWQPMIQTFLNYDEASINNGNLYFVGPQASYKMDGMDFSGWFLYEGGTVTADSGADSTDIKIQAMAASAAAHASVGGVKLGARGFWFSKAGNSNDKWKGLFIPTTGELAPFGDTDMMIFFGDVYTTTFGPEGDLNGWAMDDAVYAGYGLYGLCLKGQFSPPAMKDLYVKAAVGYFRAADDNVQDSFEVDGKTLGYEGTLRVGIKIAKAADFSLNGGYASLGNFYNNTAPDGDDPDNPWMTYAMLNVNY